ncbi:MAG TPA: hypothetical protein VH063_11250 [Gaiellaceae bacterium]|nr:hypothetical protein [Gaiellaceae bacterium]
MADKEHPASKAGRYVRAAGIVVGKEIDKRAAAAAAKPPPPPKAPPPPPPPPAATTTFAGKAIFRYFVFSLILLGLTLFHVADYVGGAERIVRLTLSALLLIQALMLLTNWHQASDRIRQRLLTRMWGHRGAANRRERAVARIAKDGLTLFGIAFLAGAVFQLVVAFVGGD